MDNSFITIIIAIISMLATLYTLITKAGSDKITELRQEIADCRRECSESNAKLHAKEAENASLQAANQALVLEKLVLMERIVRDSQA